MDTGLPIDALFFAVFFFIALGSVIYNFLSKVVNKIAHIIDTKTH